MVFLTKNNIQLLIAAIKVAQESGKIALDAMVSAGNAYQNASGVLAEMSDGDVLIIFKPDSPVKPENKEID